jgi:hypothetical protein
MKCTQFSTKVERKIDIIVKSGIVKKRWLRDTCDLGNLARGLQEALWDTISYVKGQCHEFLKTISVPDKEDHDC